ncbi:unnamed protein product [Cladocopium goreaui]|uniref:Uncharacterized protein n=1 Tax=Cladocopium goreaui TaxID=2562237 RepID=A0A9P1M2W9_9DINO|nr:unnamed protein product [Cladocopium goreaui]
MICGYHGLETSNPYIPRHSSHHHHPPSVARRFKRSPWKSRGAHSRSKMLKEVNAASANQLDSSLSAFEGKGQHQRGAHHRNSLPRCRRQGMGSARPSPAWWRGVKRINTKGAMKSQPCVANLQGSKGAAEVKPDELGALGSGSHSVHH